jgi:hypothetical protein
MRKTDRNKKISRTDTWQERRGGRRHASSRRNGERRGHDPSFEKELRRQFHTWGGNREYMDQTEIMDETGRSILASVHPGTAQKSAGSSHWLRIDLFTPIRGSSFQHFSTLKIQASRSCFPATLGNMCSYDSSFSLALVV